MCLEVPCVIHKAQVSRNARVHFVVVVNCILILIFLSICKDRSEQVEQCCIGIAILHNSSTTVPTPALLLLIAEILDYEDMLHDNLKEPTRIHGGPWSGLPV